MWLPTFKLNCQDCSTEDKVANGCFEDSPIQGVWEYDGWKFQRCPVKVITYNTRKFLKAYHRLKMFGKFPYGDGGWMEQAPKLISAFEVIESEFANLRKDEAE